MAFLKFSVPKLKNCKDLVPFFSSLPSLIRGWSLGLLGYMKMFPVFLHFIPLREEADKKIWDFP